MDQKVRLLLSPVTMYTLHIEEGYWGVIITHYGDAVSTAGSYSEELMTTDVIFQIRLLRWLRIEF
jgi:hypothetical protein